MYSILFFVPNFGNNYLLYPFIISSHPQRINIDVNEKIDFYIRSNKDNDINVVEQKLLHNAEDIRDGEGKLVEMKPQLESLKKQVEDR